MRGERAKRTLGHFSNELQLMLACADSQAMTHNAEKIKKLVAQPIDWEALSRMAFHHRVYSLVYKTLRSLGEGVMPAPIAATLRQKCRENAMQSLRLTGAAVALVNSLKEEGIRSVVLKGPPLAQRLYGDLALRPFRDIDLLVWPDDLERSGQVLEQLGYELLHPDFTLTPSQYNMYIKRGHHFNYWHKGLKTQIELHWRFGHTGLELPLSTIGTIARNSSGVSLPVLEDAEWLLFLIVHGAIHSWFRLRWLCDIGEFTRLELDWEKVRHLAEKLNIQTLLHQSLILTNQLLDATVPMELQPTLAKDDKAWRLAQLAVPFFQNINYEPFNEKRGRDWRMFWLQKRYDLQVRMRWKNKLDYILNMAGPSEENLKQFVLPDSMFWGYYALRPFTWLWRHTRKL